MSSIMRRRRRGNRCDNHILSGRRLQISVPPDLAAPTTRAQVALPISRHPGLGFRGSMAGQRGIKDGDVVRIYNSPRRLPRRRGRDRYDVARSREALVLGLVRSVPRGRRGQRPSWGNANVLTHDRGTSKLSQGPSSGTNMVEIERWKEPLPPVRTFEPPEVVPGITNSPWTGWSQNRKAPGVGRQPGGFLRAKGKSFVCKSHCMGIWVTKP